jgi:hypothetical protein
VLVPGYDVEGKLWTVQYGKEDGTKRFAKNSRKHGCFHVVDAAKGPTALQKIALSPVVVIEEGYATAATIAKYGVAQGLTYFNDLAIQNPEVVSRQLNEILQGIREQRLAASQSVELACSLTFAQQKL